MRIEPVDERDSNWELSTPRFRVYLFAPSGPGYSVATYDVTEADALDVVRWAQEQAGDQRLYAVALVLDNPDKPAGYERGLIWLVGMDANDTPMDPWEERLLAGMHRRLGRAVVAEG